MTSVHPVQGVYAIIRLGFSSNQRNIVKSFYPYYKHNQLNKNQPQTRNVTI